LTGDFGSENKLSKSTFLPNQRINLNGFPLRSIPAGYPNVANIMVRNLPQRPNLNKDAIHHFSQVEGAAYLAAR